MTKKLQRPPVPHAEVTRRVLERLRAMTPAEAIETFVKAGILRSDGKLVPPYEEARSRWACDELTREAQELGFGYNDDTDRDR